MTDTPTLFDRPAAIAAGKEGQARADDHAADDWKAQADAAIFRTARRLERFDADDVWEHGGLERTRENRALGPRLTAAAKAGLIVATNEYRRSRQVQCHGMPRRVWRSLIFEDAS